MITEENIGLVAGMVWEELKKSEQLPISKIPKAVKEGDIIVYLALGWLAREGNLKFDSKGNKNLVSLSK